MKMTQCRLAAKTILLGLVIVISQATYAQVAISTFQAGDRLSAATMNANFAAMKAAIEALQTRVATLEAERASQQATITTLQSNLAAAQTALATVQGNSVLALDGYLRFELDARGYATAHFDAVNVQISNGTAVAMDLSGPSSVNGLGNLVIGYNIEATSGPVICSLGPVYPNQSSCESAGGVWSYTFKTGSHNLVIGEQHNFGRENGLITGFHNSVIARSAGIVAGFNNIVNGEFSSIVSGQSNIASGSFAAIAGGYNNHASAEFSGLLGGSSNSANGGGATVTGGFRNNAIGTTSSISGGKDETAISDYEWRAGPLFSSDF